MKSINEYLITKNTKIRGNPLGKFIYNNINPEGSDERHIERKTLEYIGKDFNTGGLELDPNGKGFNMINPSPALKKLGHDYSWKSIDAKFTSIPAKYLGSEDKLQVIDVFFSELLSR